MLLDPFFGGRTVGDEELIERLRALPGGRQLNEVPPDAVRVASTPEVLARMLRNLLRVYAERRDTSLALAAVDLLLVLSPDSADDLRMRGALYESLDCAAAALADFRRYLALAPTAPDADDVRERLTRLARTNPTLH